MGLQGIETLSARLESLRPDRNITLFFFWFKLKCAVENKQENLRYRPTIKINGKE
jgi:hypothetical protein